MPILQPKPRLLLARFDEVQTVDELMKKKSLLVNSSDWLNDVYVMRDQTRLEKERYRNRVAQTVKRIDRIKQRQAEDALEPFRRGTRIFYRSDLADRLENVQPSTSITPLIPTVENDRDGGPQTVQPGSSLPNDVSSPDIEIISNDNPQ